MNEILEDIRNVTIEDEGDWRPSYTVVPPEIYDYLKREGEN